MMGLKDLRLARRQRYGSLNADPTLHIKGSPLENSAGGGGGRKFKLHFFLSVGTEITDKSCVIINSK